MFAFDIKQYQYECASSMRSLTFMMEENIQLKNRLSELLKGMVSTDLLNLAEGFQNKILAQENIISGLREDIRVFDRVIAREGNVDGVRKERIVAGFENLRQKIADSEQKFNSIKSEFNKYCQENF